MKIGPVQGNDKTECLLRCEQSCSDTQIKCTGKFDDNGCRENDFCVEKGYDNNGNVCPGFCPFECNPDENQCPSPLDSNGCEQPPSCKPKDHDSSGGICPNKACPVMCTVEVEHLCKGPQSKAGCMEDDVCIPKEESDNGMECPGRCPVYCDPWVEILCTGQIIYHGPKSGCFNEDECRPLAKGVTGETCPIESDDHGCPITCPEPEYVKCAPQYGENGCKKGAICEKKEVGKDGEYCPDNSVCPTVCEPYELRCNQTGVDDNGCTLPDLCIVQERNFAGEFCEVHCPPQCDPENEILCPGGIYVSILFTYTHCILWEIYHYFI